MKDLDCPNIVKLLDVLTTTNNCYIVSELCTGGDLREFMKRAVRTQYLYNLGCYRRINSN